MIEAVTDPDTLRRVYREILAPSFPDTELVQLDAFVALTRRHVTDAGTPRADVLVSRDGAALRGAIVGTQVGEVMLVSWLAVGPAGRGAGVGGQLLDAAVPRWIARDDVRLVLAEVERPDRYRTHPQFGDPSRRLAFYGRRGALALTLPYFQPSIAPGKPRQHGLLLLVLAATDELRPRTLSAQERAAVRAYVGQTLAGPDGLNASTTDPALAAVTAAIDASEGVALLPVQDYRQIPVTRG